MKIILMLLIATGAFAMTKPEIIEYLTKEAQTSIKDLDVNNQDAEITLKTDMLNKGFTKQEIINFSTAYSKSYPRNAGNALDTEIRKAAGYINSPETYWTGIQPVQKINPDDHGIVAFIKNNWQWLALGAGLLILGPTIFRALRKD